MKHLKPNKSSYQDELLKQIEAKLLNDLANSLASTAAKTSIDFETFKDQVAKTAQTLKTLKSRIPTIPDNLIRLIENLQETPKIQGAKVDLVVMDEATNLSHRTPTTASTTTSQLSRRYATGQQAPDWSKLTTKDLPMAGTMSRDQFQKMLMQPMVNPKTLRFMDDS